MMLWLRLLKRHNKDISQYAAEMREKDIRKCAPFVHDDDDDESKLRKQLVPLHVPEFRWWRCESCVQDVSVSSDSESKQIVEKAISSSTGGEIHASACGNKEKDDALIALIAVPGKENCVNDVSNQRTGEQTLSLATCPPCQIPERHTNGTVGEESMGKELTDDCVPEPGGNVAASDVLPTEYTSQKSSSFGDVCPAEKTDGLNKDTSNLVVTNEASKKDVEQATIHISDSDSEEDGASAGTGFRSPMPLQETGNGPCPSKLNSYKSMPRRSFEEDIGLNLSLSSYMEVDKINTPVPQKKTVLKNDLWRKEGNCIGQSSAPNLSFSEAVVGDISGKNAYSSYMMHREETSLSLHKKLCGCIQPAVVPTMLLLKFSTTEDMMAAHPICGHVVSSCT